MHWQLLVILATPFYTELHSFSLHCRWNITLQVNSIQMCSSRKYPYLPNGRQPTPLEIPIKPHAFHSICWSSRPPPLRKLQSLQWGERGRNGYFQEQLNDDFFAMQWLAISTITIGKHSHLTWRNIWTLTSSKERFKKKGNRWCRLSSISSFSHSSTSWIWSSLCDGTRWA